MWGVVGNCMSEKLRVYGGGVAGVGRCGCGGSQVQRVTGAGIAAKKIRGCRRLRVWPAAGVGGCICERIMSVGFGIVGRAAGA